MAAHQGARIKILELDALDSMELRGELPRESYHVEREALERGQRGTLGLSEAVIIILSSQAIHGIAAWLLKKRQRQSVTLRIEKISPDGTVQREHLEIGLADSTAPEENVVRQLTEAASSIPGWLKAD
jgi:hypothetical protein